MKPVTISKKYQAVIPRKIREQYNLAPGQKVVFIPFKNSLRMIIVPKVEKAFGFLIDLDPSVNREEINRT